MTPGGFSPSLSTLFTEVGLSLDPRPSEYHCSHEPACPRNLCLCLLRAGIAGRVPCLRGTSTSAEDPNSHPCPCGKYFACWVISPAVLQVVTDQIRHLSGVPSACA